MLRRASRLISVNATGGEMPAHQWLPDALPAPGLVLVQEIFGVGDYVQDRAGDLADLGYVVTAPDLYWRLDDREIDESSPDGLARAMEVAGQVDWDLAVADVTATLVALRGSPEVDGRAGLLGFCFGGGLAFQAAAVADPDLLVVYYGSALPRLLHLAGQVTCPSLHHFGLADSFILPPQVAEIREAVTAHGARFETYPEADHAFDNPLLPLHDPAASQLAWSTTERFLAEFMPVRQYSVG